MQRNETQIDIRQIGKNCFHNRVLKAFLDSLVAKRDRGGFFPRNICFSLGRR
jgi:hypothetical protein